VARGDRIHRQGHAGSIRPDVAAPIYYIVGPPAMVTAMKETLTGAGVSEDDIRSEDFAGY
jgi:hypothetical protein